MITQTDNLPDASDAQAASEEDAANEPVSLDSMIDNAFDTVDGEIENGTDGAKAKPADPVDPEVVELSPEEQAAADAKAAEEAAAETAVTLPERFKGITPEAWGAVPPEVQAEVERMRTELEAGLAEKDAALEPYQGLEEFQKMAADGGTTLKDAMTHYAGLENLFAQNPMAGFQQLSQNLGLNMHQVAAEILNVNPNQQAMQQNQQTMALNQKIEKLEKQLAKHDETFTQQQNSVYENQVAEFAAANEHYAAVEDDMVMFINSGRAKDLSSAYDLALKLHGLEKTPKAPSAAEQAEIDKKAALAAQTRKGKLSVTGAPNKGSKPKKAANSPSIDKALDDAFAEVG